MRVFWLLIFLAAVVTTTFMIRAIDPTPVKSLRLETFDYFQELKPRPKFDESPVLIAGIDEKSLQEFGQWPWDRSTVAQITKVFREAGATLVAFDIVFADRDRIDLTRDVWQNDAAFSSELAKSPVVLARATSFEDQVNGEFTHADYVLETHKTTESRALSWVPPVFNIVFNLGELESSARGAGLISTHAFRNLITRKIPSFLTTNKSLYPSLFVEVLRVKDGSKKVKVFAERNGISKVAISEKTAFTTDQSGSLWPYFTPSQNMRYRSLADLVRDKSAREELRGKIVFIGAVAAGLKDIRSNPIEPAVPGVENHAQAIESVLSGNYLLRTVEIEALEVWTVPIATLVLSIGLLIFPMKGTLPWFAVIQMVLIFGSWTLFSWQQILFDVTFPVIANFIIAIVLIYWRSVSFRSSS